MQDSKTRSNVLTWAVVGVGLAAIADSTRLALAHPPDARWVPLTILTLLGAAAMVKTRAGLSLSISDSFTFTTLYLLGPAPATLTAALEALAGSILLSPGQRTIRRMLFNVAAVGLAMRMAGTVFAALAGDDPAGTAARAPFQVVVPMLLAAALYFFANTALVAAAVSFERGDPFARTWRTHLAHLSVSFFGGAYVALLLTLLSPTLNLGGSLLLIPMPLLLYAVFRSWNERVNDQIAFLDSMNRQYKATIGALAHAIDAKDQVTHGHILRVQTMSLALARRLGGGDNALLQALEAASLLHDLGKIAIPEHILNKPGRLTAAEYERMKEHAGIGAEILSAIEFPYPVVPIVRHHHEAWDGSGYPDGLRGEAIPLGARILAVVDCFDALTSDRPYRPRMSTREAFAILRQRRGGMYDPAVVDAFLDMQQLLPDVNNAPSQVALPPSMAPHGRDQAPAPPLTVKGHDECLFGGIGEPVLRLACERLGATAGILLGYDEQCDALRLALVCGDIPRIGTMILQRGEGVSGWVAGTRRSQLNSDARLDFGPCDAIPAAGLQSALSVPIMRGSAMIGVVTLYSPEQFSDSCVPLLELLALVIASATPEPALTLTPAVPNTTRRLALN